jgi:hypothetical protein
MQDDEIADALDRLYAGGWSIGDTAFFVEGGGLVHVVTGSNGENMIRARRVPRRGGGRSTRPRRSVCCRVGHGRRWDRGEVGDSGIFASEEGPGAVWSRANSLR